MRYPIRLLTAAVLLASAGGPAASLRAEVLTLLPAYDGWIRAQDDFVRQSDYISVWSSAFGRRYGLLQFDLAPIAGRTLLGVTLDLYSPVTGSSSDDEPLRQFAYSIDTQGGTAMESGDLTWAVYAAEYEGRETRFETLGACQAGAVATSPELQNVYLASTASAQDRETIQALSNTASRRLNLVLKMVEGGQSAYKADWGDMERTGGSSPARLRVEVAPVQACAVRGSLPAATCGQPYSESLIVSQACPAGVRVEISGCALPPGLSLDPASGRIAGTTRYSGAFPLHVRLLDGTSALIEEADLDLRVEGPFDTRADIDQDGDVDLLDFDALVLGFTGPRSSQETCDPGPSPGGEFVLPATGDVWIRESDGTNREGDWVSVWSSASHDGAPGGRRYGLIEFDVRPLAGQTLGAAHLRMWVADSYSGTTKPIRQRAYVIPSDGTPLVDLTWSSYFAEKSPGKMPLASLGAYDQGPPINNGTAGAYIDDPGASAADLALISAEADGDGVLSLVLIADEDGTDYRGDWGDGSNPGGPGLSEKPALLRVWTGSSCLLTTSDLPAGVLGRPYEAVLSAASACSQPLKWGVSACSLPPGLTLGENSGRISGTPSEPGTHAFRIQLSDTASGTLRERDYAIEVTGRHPSDIDGDGDVDTADFARLQASFTGPLDPDLDFCWRDYVTRALDTLIEHGRDRYGPVHTSMLAAILDVNTLESPENPPLLDGDVRTEGRPMHGRRSPGGSNLWLDTPTVQAMYRLSEMTGDAKYAQAADAYISDYFKHAVKTDGLLNWGSHVYYHLFQDRAGGDGDGSGPHEILIHHPPWDHMYRLQPAATRTEVDAIWTWHICDKATGQHNRHSDAVCALDFAYSGGSFILAFASLYAATGEQSYLDKARLIANWHWNHRDPATGLLMDAPSAGGRYDAHHSFTSVTGPFASQLLRASEVSGEALFREQAISYIKAYDRYGWDEAAGTYYAMLTLGGAAVLTQASGSGYDQYIPNGHVDVWRTIMFSYEFPLIAAQAALYAYQVSGGRESGDPELLRIACRWARAIERDLPPRLGDRWRAEVEAAMPGVVQTGGTYAENYGRAISFFVGLFEATGEQQYRRRARVLAREATRKLYVNGLFRGHPAKDYYQANDGVGFLLLGLLQLDACPQGGRPAF